MPIYLDNASTTRVDQDVLEAMLPFFTQYFGNPSSAHDFGHNALRACDGARITLAKFFNCDPGDVIFTGSATEANNLFLDGVIALAIENGIANPKIITTKIEHPSILAVCENLEKNGVIVEYINPDSVGVIDAQSVLQAIDANTVLVSVMYVNNETGAIQPIRKIGKEIMKINENNEKRWRQARVGDRGKRPQKVLFHTDATQAIQFLNCDVSWNYLDLLTCSAHKIYGPKGVGALICKEGIELKPILKGGGQERGRRSGTLNVPGIVGLASAIQKLDSNFIKENNQKIAQLKNLIISELTEKLKNWHINGSVDNSIPAILNISFDGIDAESIMIALDMKGVAISTGSACATHKLNYSHVLHAMGVNEKNSRSAIRISLGKYNTEKEILDSVKILIEVIKKIVH